MREINSVRPFLRRRLKQPFEPPLQMQQNRFDVLARAQAVDAKIHAVTGKLTPAHIADFDRVNQPAARGDAEVREDRVARVKVGDGEGLVAGALAAPVDFLGVGRAPVVWRRELDFGGCFCHAAMIALRRRRSKRSCCCLFTRYSQVERSSGVNAALRHVCNRWQYLDTPDAG